MGDEPGGGRRRRGLSLRLRLILAASGAVAVAVILAASGAYLIVRHELRHQIDVSLHNTASSLNQGPGPIGDRNRLSVVQVLNVDGSVRSGGLIPVTGDDRAVAEGRSNDHFHDVTVQNIHLRVYTVGLVGGGAVELAANLNAVDATLKQLTLLLALLALGGVALGTALGTLVARAALVPVDRLTAAAERVAATMDLSAPIEVHGADEVARLGQALNTLLATVDQSQRAQRRLVADASHELRTPLTSLRTNLELLARSPDIAEDERRAILSDLVAQAAELSALVAQLVDLEREPVTSGPPSPVAFDEVVEAALARARLHSPQVRFVETLEPTPVVGQAAVLERAVANLLDNAAKWSPAGAQIEVNLVGGTLSVRDHGPGIDPADAPHVFERFYRSARARALPGSGLGLSIVRQAAEEHGGQAWILPAPGGGTVACLRIPSVTDPAPLGPTAPPPPDPAGTGGAPADDAAYAPGSAYSPGSG
ncbi:MAG TPA: HAMP domain-containing sensor histidine kinase [Acidimicrobiales bacterium]